MRKVVIIPVVSALLLGGIAFGQVKKARGGELCNSLERFAAKAMKKRQHGVRMQRVMEVVNNAEASLQVKKIMRSIVKDAYNQPNWDTEEREEEAVREFRNDFDLLCAVRLE